MSQHSIEMAHTHNEYTIEDKTLRLGAKATSFMIASQWLKEHCSIKSIDGHLEIVVATQPHPA
jgi:hypothetical protein